MTRRSLLFTPADRPDMMRSAADSDADALIFDLEDAVAPVAKSGARRTVREVVSDAAFGPPGELFVRINPVDRRAGADLDGLAPVGEHIDGVMLPKVSAADDVETVGKMLAEHGMAKRVIPLIESAAGVLAAAEIAAAKPTIAVAFGAEDLSADIGATRTDDGVEVLHARETVVLAAAAATVEAIDTVYTDFEDEEGLETDTRFAAQLGFDGKLAIHPAQVAPINRAFSPDPADVEWAKRVVEANESTDDAVFRVDGEMIDAPLLAQAERILSRADSADSS